MAQGPAKKIGLDHGDMVGLGDDDHPQYHNDARHFAEHSAARYTNSTSQTSLAASTFIQVVFNTTDREDDINGDFTLNTSTGLVTINNAGWYNIAGGIVMALTTTGTRSIFRIGLGGLAAGDALVTLDSQSAASTSVLNGSTIAYLDAADVIHMGAWHGASGWSITNRQDTFLSIVRVA